jgi:hypothetical protein
MAEPLTPRRANILMGTVIVLAAVAIFSVIRTQDALNAARAAEFRGLEAENRAMNLERRVNDLSTKLNTLTLRVNAIPSH